MSCRRLVTCVIAFAAAGPVLAGKAHEHGSARLDIAVAADRLHIALETPLDNLLGFERAPRNDAERQRADAAVALLRAADRMFRIDPAAGCTLARVEVVSPALQRGAAGDAPGAADHADLEGRYDFVCSHGARAGFVELGLFEAFKGLSRVEVQAVTPKGQMKATLRRPASRLALVR